MATYQLEATRATLHGTISREHTPVLTVASGDTVRYRTLDAGWGLEPLLSPTHKRRKFEPRGEHDKGHALIGPLIIEGAKAGKCHRRFAHYPDCQRRARGSRRAATWGHSLKSWREFWKK